MGCAKLEVLASEAWLLWDPGALSSDLHGAPPYSQVRSEFNKDFRQQMKNYPKDNQTASILDKMQKDVSGVAGSRHSRRRRFLPPC